MNVEDRINYIESNSTVTKANAVVRFNRVDFEGLEGRIMFSSKLTSTKGILLSCGEQFSYILFPPGSFRLKRWLGLKSGEPFVYYPFDVKFRETTSSEYELFRRCVLGLEKGFQ